HFHLPLTEGIFLPVAHGKIGRGVMQSAVADLNALDRRAGLLVGGHAFIIPQNRGGDKASGRQQGDDVDTNRGTWYSTKTSVGNHCGKVRQSAPHSSNVSVSARRVGSMVAACIALCTATLGSLRPALKLFASCLRF